MKIRKITANTMPEAMTKVKSEFGSDAVILYTRNITKKRFFGLSNKKAIEVVVALDELSSSPPQVVEDKVSDFKNMLREEERSWPPTHNDQGKFPAHIPSEFRHADEWPISEPISVKRICQKLLSAGVSARHVDAIGQALLKFWYSHEQEPDEGSVLNQLKDILKSKLSEADFSGLDYKNRILVLLGPTGVGKTTTAAKLASKAFLDEGKSVAFITTDTYRIAAVEQLKTYAKILNVPVSVAYSMDDFKKAMHEFKDKDLIIVDSAGRNYQQSQFVKEIKELIPFGVGIETHLVLAATAKPNDLSHITSQFRDIPIHKFIFTKVDETKDIASLINLILDYGIGVSYFTNGQDVPDDLIEAEKAAFIRQVMEGVSHGRSS
ncbi:MAG: flagellar biosynthesis protein FlhF [Tuberibacillus sp.]